MRTEADIIYGIWDIVRAGEVNADDPINERLMRAFLRIHRGKLLTRYCNNGMELPDEVFQYIQKDFFKKDGVNLVSEVMPKVIRFKDNFGIQITIDGYDISIVNASSWRRALKDRFNKYHPLAKFINNRVVIYSGQIQPNLLEDFSSSHLNTIVQMLKDLENEELKKIGMQAVLVDPDDGSGYNFTKSPYPMPDELIEDLINSVNAREFNLFLRTASDETTNMRNDAKQQNDSPEL
jgi:hypothetical protein